MTARLLSVANVLPLLAVTGISVSVGGVIVGLLLGALVYFVAVWLLGLMGFPHAQEVAAILAILVFIGCAFNV